MLIIPLSRYLYRNIISAPCIKINAMSHMQLYSVTLLACYYYKDNNKLLTLNKVSKDPEAGILSSELCNIVIKDF